MTLSMSPTRLQINMKIALRDKNLLLGTKTINDMRIDIKRMKELSLWNDGDINITADEYIETERSCTKKMGIENAFLAEEATLISETEESIYEIYYTEDGEYYRGRYISGDTFKKLIAEATKQWNNHQHSNLKDLIETYDASGFYIVEAGNGSRFSEPIFFFWDKEAQSNYGNIDMQSIALNDYLAEGVQAGTTYVSDWIIKGGGNDPYRIKICF